MRNAYVPEVLVESRHSAPSKIMQRDFWGRQLPQALLTAQDLRDHLPHWLGGRRPPSQPLVPMLRALKTAVEARLETTVSNAQVVSSYPLSEDLREELRSAFSSISLSMPASLHSPAGIFAAGAYGVGKNYGDDCKEQLILTVEYSKAALTAVIAHEECGVFEYRRVLHDMTLGSDVPGLNREKLEEALRGFVRLPLDDGGNGSDLAYLNNLVLLGESADDSQLHETLREVLQDQYERLEASFEQKNSGPIDPLSAGSRGVAENCLDWLNPKSADSGQPLRS
jgi:hypothetical protein